jgi:hypothetical protein
MTEQNLTNSMGATLGVGTNEDPQGLGQMPPAQIPQVTTTSAPVAPGTPTPVAPVTPPAPGTAPVPATATRQNPTPQPPANQPPAPPAHMQWFGRLLSGLVRPITTQETDPATGESKMVSRPGNPTPANLLIAGALSGMFAKPQYRQGEFGPVYDSGGTASEAFNAGQQQVQQKQEQAQKLSDSQLASKLAVAKLNIDQMHAHAVSTQIALQSEELQHKIFDDNAASSKPTIDLADAYDKSLSDPKAPRARLAQNMPMDELLKHPEFKTSLTTNAFFPDGVTTEVDPETGNPKPAQTYSILNPAITVPLSKEFVDRAAAINPQFADAWDKTDGNMPMRLGQMMTVVNQINSVNAAETALQDAADSKDPLLLKFNPHLKTDVTGALATAVRTSPQALKALEEYSNAIAQGGGVADGFRRILLANNGVGADPIFKALGTTADNARAYVEAVANQRKAEESKAAGASKEEIALLNDQTKEKIAANKEVQAKQKLMGYAEDQNGNLQYVSKWDTEDGPNAGNYSAQTFSEMKPSDVAKDRALVKPLGDVQMNLSHYRSAVNAYTFKTQNGQIAPAQAAKDKTALTTIFSSPAITDASQAHGGVEGFGITIPTVAADLNSMLAKKVTDAYNDLSPEAKQLADNYARANAAIPAWVKALTNSGRGSKEQLEIELKNILPPYYDMKDIHNRLDGFQDNLENQKKSVPQNLLGRQMPTPVVRTDKAPAGATGIVKDSQGNAIGYLVNGKPVDASGNPLVQGRQ